jgi:hypothetical protein
MRFTIALLIAASCFGQGKHNVIQTGTIVPPQATFASPPSSPATGGEWTFTDASAVGVCSGGGSALAKCRWSGSAWQAVGGAGGSSGSDTAIFGSGTIVQRLVQCAHGTINYTDLTTAGASQEVTIETAVSGDVRYDQVLVNPSTAFTGGSATLPTVSMGRTGSNNYEMTGALIAIGSGSTPWAARPVPPQLTSTYSIVLNFAVATGNVNGFTAGALDWEVCGHAGR